MENDNDNEVLSQKDMMKKFIEEKKQKEQSGKNKLRAPKSTGRANSVRGSKAVKIGNGGGTLDGK